jgi:hypothetical protein
MATESRAAKAGLVVFLVVAGVPLLALSVLACLTFWAIKGDGKQWKGG